MREPVFFSEPLPFTDVFACALVDVLSWCMTRMIGICVSMLGVFSPFFKSECETVGRLRLKERWL